MTVKKIKPHVFGRGKMTVKKLNLLFSKAESDSK